MQHWSDPALVLLWPLFFLFLLSLPLSQESLVLLSEGTWQCVHGLPVHLPAAPSGSAVERSAKEASLPINVLWKPGHRVPAQLCCL